MLIPEAFCEHKSKEVASEQSIVGAIMYLDGTTIRDSVMRNFSVSILQV